MAKRSLENCFLCAILPIAKFGLVFGTFPFSYRCPHTKVPSRLQTIDVSTKGLACTLVLVTLLLVDGGWHLSLLSKAASTMEAFVLLNDVFFLTTGVLILVGKVQRIGTAVAVSRAWFEVFETRSSYAISALLSDKDVRLLRRKAFMYVLLLVTLGVSGCAFGHWVIVTAAVIDGITVLNFNLDVLCMERMISNINLSVKQSMLTCDALLASKLKKTARLHSALRLGYLNKSKLFSRYFFFWILSVLISTIASYYIIITALFVTHSGSVFGLLYRVNYVAGLLVYWLGNVERLTRTSDDLLSFLFKFPISKLRADEAAQVEMLIYTLKIQKPVLKASDIFIVGTRLLAPISGTVVTYVLVALQFHKTWSK